jgi:hypothetical protein
VPGVITDERRLVKSAIPRRPRQRVAILFDPARPLTWERRLIEVLAVSPSIEIALLISSRSEMAASTDGKPVSWRLVDAVERRWARLLGRPCGPKATVEEAHLRHVPIVDIQGRDNLIAARLDVILNVSGRTPSCCLQGVARHGVWSIRAKGTPSDEVRPLGFAECLANVPACGIEVVSFGGAEGGEFVRASGVYTTSRLSWTLNADRLAQRASWLLVDAIGCASDQRPSGIPREIKSNRESRVDDLQMQDTWRAPWALGKIAGRSTLEITRRLLKEDRWRILLFSGTPTGRVIGAPTILEAPAGSYWADPFVVRHNGKCAVFFEEYLYSSRRGIISYVELDELANGSILRPPARRLFDEAYHLSYPYVFRSGSALYMIPESSGNLTVDLWVCESFPGKWRKVRTLLAGVRAVDSSVVYSQGLWWLFTNLDQTGLRDNGNDLHLFYSDDLLSGRWTPHVQNPIVADARCARMAGGFLDAGPAGLVRCGQVQGLLYGEAVTYKLITELSPSRYAEVTWPEAVPVPLSHGRRTHHMSYADGLIAADECRRNWRPWRVLMTIADRRASGKT